MLIPRLGQGTRYLGQKIRPGRQGMELGMTSIDPAEMYGEGRRVTGKAVSHIERKKLFLVFKGIPHNAGRKGV